MDEDPGFAQDGKWLGEPRSGVCYGCFALAEERASRSGWACSPAGDEGQRRCAHLLFPSPRTPQRLSSRSPRAGPVCRRGPGRSGRSWTSADWKAAASQSEPGPDPPRCGQRRRVRRLSGTPTRDTLSPLPHARTLKHRPPLPQNTQWAPYTPPPAPRAHPAAGHACSRVSNPPAEQGRAPRTRGRAMKVSFGFCAGDKPCKHLLRPDTRCVGRKKSGGGCGEPAFAEYSWSFTTWREGSMGIGPRHPHGSPASASRAGEDGWEQAQLLEAEAILQETSSAPAKCGRSASGNRMPPPQVKQVRKRI